MATSVNSEIAALASLLEASVLGVSSLVLLGSFVLLVLLAELSEDLGEAMVGINEQEIEILMAERGK